MREMQSSLDEHGEAMAFSEKMLALSREQTDSLHALRESLREKETIMMHKESEMRALKDDFGDQMDEMRQRLVQVQDHNRLLQEQLLQVQGLAVERNQLASLENGYAEMKQQLALSMNKYTNLRTRMQDLQRRVAVRMISQWRHASVSSAFNAWLQVVSICTYIQE
jgi:hypothetical protein